MEMNSLKGTGTRSCCVEMHSLKGLNGEGQTYGEQGTRGEAGERVVGRRVRRKKKVQVLWHGHDTIHIDNENFSISDLMFKAIISSSLPQSWDTFAELFVSLQKEIN